MQSGEFSDEWAVTLRRKMVDQQLRARGIADEHVLAAMGNLPRHRFVPAEFRESAYDDSALSIGHGQTISQPFLVAHMTSLLAVESSSRVLEIGTGCGYQTAVLSRLAARVFTIERLKTLCESARSHLTSLGLTNIKFRVGDGSLGWPELAPFDRILVTAGTPAVPCPLVEQLADGGRLVLPVGGPRDQTLLLIRRDLERYEEISSIGCRFVKLIGEQGWSEPDTQR